MLVYVAARVNPGGDPQCIVAAFAVREADLEHVKRRFGSSSDAIEAVAAFVTEERTRALLAIVASWHFPSGTVSDVCFRGLYSRLQVLMDWGLRPTQDWPSLFVRIRGDMHQFAQASLSGATRNATENRLLFVNAESDTSTGLICAETVLAQVAGWYQGEATSGGVVEAFHPFGRPSGWVHYTLDPECRCPGCIDALRAVVPLPQSGPNETAKPVTKLPSRSANLTIDQLILPRHTFNALKAARIRTVDELGSMTEQQLLRLQNVGRSDVEHIRSALAKYRAS
jgi:hypothetical protein